MRTLAVVCASLVLALPSVSSAQARVSVGLGGGIAGSTEGSLSEGKAAPVVMGEVSTSIAPLIGIGAEADYWRRRVSNFAFAAAVVQFHIPATGLFLKIGGGYGSGDPDGNGTISGAAGVVGAMYDITIPAAPVALTLFGNAFIVHGSPRYGQMVDGGIAITWR